MKPAIIMTWTESERGMGQRPDGASLHLSQEDLREFIRDYWAQEQERNPSGDVPDEYSRPDGDRGTLVLVDEKLHQVISGTKHGLSFTQHAYCDMMSKGRIVKDLEYRPAPSPAAPLPSASEGDGDSDEDTELVPTSKKLPKSPVAKKAARKKPRKQ